ncbi:glycerophosphodiester phosphodiesterase [Pseudonocardia sp. GCM10023141]|uniref:glycerophosphodiester phosphodiesterase n=1 Tax=Pseudonocardia sp. GCM10023141 TaxID=3252653 RepID=UPI00360FA715
MDPLIYAHRGASARFAEHTRAAYLQAIADGADGVECDVHLTRDLQVVCLHDDLVDRTSNGSGPVHEYTLAELRELDFASWKGAAIPAAFGTVAEQFLSLHDLLEILRGAGRDIGIAVELKHPSPYGPRLEDEVLALLVAEGWDPATSRLANITVSFMSFDPAAVQYVNLRVDATHLCMLTGGVEAAELDGLPEVGIAGPGIDGVRTHPDTVRAAVVAGQRFRVWTVDDPADVALMAELGVQEITTNQPAEVRAQLPKSLA